MANTANPMSAFGAKRISDRQCSRALDVLPRRLARPTSPGVSRFLIPALGKSCQFAVLLDVHEVLDRVVTNMRRDPGWALSSPGHIKRPACVPVLVDKSEKLAVV